MSAPSGAGKTSLVRAAIEHLPALEVSISHTTRAQRAGERDGADYHFVDENSFNRMVENREFLEHATVFDHQYGTAAAAIRGQLGAGVDVILEIDWQGAQAVRETMENVHSIFIVPPSVDELERRLRGRGADTDTVIARRMQQAANEISHMNEYDYLIVNDDFDTALIELSAVITAARVRRVRQQNQHQAMLDSLIAP